MKHYLEKKETVFSSLDTSDDGLTPEKAQANLETYGYNKLDEGKKTSVIVKLLGQLSDPMILILLAAAIISGIVGELADLIIIMTVVVINSVLGVVQEGKAEKAIEALQQMASPYSRVRRGGNIVRVKSEEIVPGDVVLLEAGDSVSADMRLIETASMKIEEASLTGESVPSDKHADVIETKEDDVPLGDRTNMAYMGTNVVYGRGEGVVVATGMKTEMGKIANIIAEAKDEKTPLQKKLAGLSKVLSIGVLAICVFIFVFGVIENGGFSGTHVLEMFLIAISLAVAAIPEGLVAVVTIVLSIGVTKMSKRNAIIRKLTAVETLGCTQVICSDKTGTLTQNKMTVVETHGSENLLAVTMSMCSDAVYSEETKEIIGEPTESALVRYAYDLDFKKHEREQFMPRVAEAPFDSSRKMMTTVHRTEDGFIEYVKGAPDELLKACTHYFDPKDEERKPLTDEVRALILKENTKMADRALRVLAGAMKRIKELPSEISPETLEYDLTFIGLAGMIDPVRPEVKAAIDECRSAQIKPVMITGDHINTAVAIAKELKIIDNASQAITGSDLSKLSDEEFDKKINDYAVYARVQPEHKVRIVETWKRNGRITAMTGDGVNDAPALKIADIGVGMGITGTDVTKNVSDMVLADDNFASIVHAVEEGRRIYDNILKTIQFLLSSNLSEVVSLFTATMMNFILFTPPQLLWINLVTDSLPAIALGMEEAEPDIMTKAPRKSNEGVFANGLGAGVIYQGLVITALTLFSYFIGNGFTFVQTSEFAHQTAMSMAFVTLNMCEIFHSLNMRSTHLSIFSLKKQNKYLYGAMVAAFLLTVFVVYTPVINTAFEFHALNVEDFIFSMALALAIIPIVEIVKAITRSVKKKKANLA
ncbi:MAG: cation-translocating P-type ATPase [Anaerofustis sp.]